MSALRTARGPHRRLTTGAYLNERLISIYHLVSVVFSRFGIPYGHCCTCQLVESLPYLARVPTLPPGKTSAPSESFIHAVTVIVTDPIIWNSHPVPHLISARANLGNQASQNGLRRFGPYNVRLMQTRKKNTGSSSRRSTPHDSLECVGVLAIVAFRSILLPVRPFIAKSDWIDQSVVCVQWPRTSLPPFPNVPVLCRVKLVKGQALIPIEVEQKHCKS